MPEAAFLLLLSQHHSLLTEPQTTACNLKSPPSSLTLLKLRRLIIPCITTLCPATSALLPTPQLTACVLPLSYAACSVYVGNRLEAHKSGVATVKTFKFKRERSKLRHQHCFQASRSLERRGYDEQISLDSRQSEYSLLYFLQP